MTTPSFLHPFARPGADVDDFVTIVRGDGAAIFDRDGNRFVDALGGLWFCTIGHGRREVAEAVGDQLSSLAAFHCFDRYTNEPADQLCDELAASAPMSRARVFLVDSGSEAIDAALKLVRLTFSLGRTPERDLIIAREHAYHGVTYGGLALMGIAANVEGWGPLDGVLRVPYDDLSAVDAVFRSSGDRIAAVVAEPVIGAGGVRPVEADYLRGLRRLCDEHGALLVLDEVITGFGRLGERWASSRFGVEPDLITFAKGVTSGYVPLGGVVVGPRVLDVLEADSGFVLRTGHTYSGHPGACRAALVNLAIIEREGLATRADEVIGPWFSAELSRLLERGLVADVRGLSGIWAVDMVEGVSPVDVRNALLDHGVLVRPLGERTIGFCPPLVITEEDLAQVTTALERVLGAAVPAA